LPQATVQQQKQQQYTSFSTSDPHAVILWGVLAMSNKYRVEEGRQPFLKIY